MGDRDTGADDLSEDGSDSGDSSSGTVEVSVDMELTVSWMKDGKAVGFVTYEMNDSEILLHHPVETWHSGKHILSLYYPIEKLVPNITNTFNVYLRMEGGILLFSKTLEENGDIMYAGSDNLCFQQCQFFCQHGTVDGTVRGGGNGL